jgi:hypothetical protein
MIYFCHVIVKFTVSLESLYFWDTYSFEGATPGILLVTPYDLQRGGGGCLLVWCRQRMPPTLCLIERGHYEHWALVASVLEHRDNVDTTLLKFVSIIDPVLTCCFSIVIPFG